MTVLNYAHYYITQPSLNLSYYKFIPLYMVDSHSVYFKYYTIFNKSNIFYNTFQTKIDIQYFI